jgi:SAM-dependent methyltransferase
MSGIKEIERYWSASPCNIRHGTAPVGSLEWSRQVTERKYFVEPHIPGFAQFERWKNKRVVEIGCGIGTDSIEFLRSGAILSAVDISMESLKLARKRVKEEIGEWLNTCFFPMDAEERLPGHDVDLVYSFGVLHHTPHPKKVLMLAHERMADDGELRIMLYAKWSIKNLFHHQPEAQAGCPWVKFYTGWEARKLLWSCGFEVVSINKTHIFPWRVQDYIEHRYVKAFPWNITPRWLFGILERLLGCHLLILCKKGLR